MRQGGPGGCRPPKPHRIRGQPEHAAGDQPTAGGKRCAQRGMSIKATRTTAWLWARCPIRPPAPARSHRHYRLRPQARRREETLRLARLGHELPARHPAQRRGRHHRRRRPRRPAGSDRRARVVLRGPVLPAIRHRRRIRRSTQRPGRPPDSINRYAATLRSRRASLLPGNRQHHRPPRRVRRRARRRPDRTHPRSCRRGRLHRHPARQTRRRPTSWPSCSTTTKSAEPCSSAPTTPSATTTLTSPGESPTPPSTVCTG